MGIWAKLVISDGTTTVNLLAKNNGGVMLSDWTPAIAEPKNGGVWQDSPLGEGRRMAYRQFGNVIETLELSISDGSQEAVIRDTQDLRRLLEQAVAYWLDRSGSVDPVWIEARAQCETNSRYAVIYDYRTPNDNNPYGSRFNARGIPRSMTEWRLLIERGHWLDNPPGSYTCDQLTDAYTSFALGSELCLNPSFETAGGGGADVFASWAEAAGDGAVASDATPFEGAVSCKLTSGPTSNTSISQTIAVAAGGKYYFRFHIRGDGTLSTGIGCYIWDNTHGGALMMETHYAHWRAVWRQVIYEVTIPAGCVSIAIAFTCPGLNGAAGWVDMITFRRETAASYGRSVTCDRETFLSNRYSMAPITHVYAYDDSLVSYSANKIGAALPQNLFPNPCAAGDCLYIGSVAGPLTSVIFNLSGGALGADGDWEYYTGAVWTAIPSVCDDTQTSTITITPPVCSIADPFSSTGVHYTCWPPPTNQAMTTINGVYGWWIRFRVITPSALNILQQVTRQIYTPLNLGLPVIGTAINGDLPAAVRLAVETSGDYQSLEVGDMLLALRTTSRGAYFYPFFNFSSWQPRVTITATAVPAYECDLHVDPVNSYMLASPLGIHGDVLCFHPTAATTVGGGTMLISGPTAESMRGRYRLLIRVYQVGGAAGDIQVSVTLTANGSVSSDLRWPSVAGAYQWLDFGMVSIPMSHILPGDSPQVSISVGCRTALTAAWPDLYLVDLALVPVDENTNEIISSNSGGVPRQDEWILDSTDRNLLTSYLRVQGQTVAGVSFVGDVRLRSISQNGIRYQAGENQKIYWYSLNDENPGMLATPQSYHVGRYLSMRGDR